MVQLHVLPVPSLLTTTKHRTDTKSVHTCNTQTDYPIPHMYNEEYIIVTE